MTNNVYGILDLTTNSTPLGFTHIRYLPVTVGKLLLLSNTLRKNMYETNYIPTITGIFDDFISDSDE